MSKKITSAKVKDFLLSTGFPFEMKTAQELEKNGYEVSINYPFFDLEENKNREVDIVATKLINDGVVVNLIIECKQSMRDAWIFISPKNVERYWSFAKCSPDFIDFDNKQKAMNGLHVFDEKIPLANNFLTYDLNQGKKSDHSSISDAVFKIIKGLAAVISKNRKKETKNIYYSVVCFSGEMFTATYKSQLVVKKINWLQLKQQFKPQAYDIVNNENEAGSPEMLFGHKDYGKSFKASNLNSLRNTMSSFGGNHLIDIVTRVDFNKFLNRIESDVKKISLDLWSLPKKPLKNIFQIDPPQKI